MKLPFVSREAYEARERELERAEHRYDELFVSYTQLHDRAMAILVEATKRPEPVKPQRAERDPVIDAILARAGNNGALRAHLSAWAMKERRNGAQNEDIINRILVWGDPDDDVSPNGPA